MVKVMADDYLSVATLPRQPTPDDLLAFFNIPPDPADSLDDNIARKRRHWHSLAASSPAGREKAKRVKALIQDAADALKRGTAMSSETAADDTARTTTPAGPERARTVDEVWAELEELMFANRIQEALNLATSARATWPYDPKAHRSYAWCVAGILEHRPVTDEVLGHALGSIDFALRNNDGDAALWDIAVRLRLGRLRPDEALSTTEALRHEEALRVLETAERRLGTLDQRLVTSRAVARLRLGKVVEGLADAVAAVRAGGNDAAVRSQVAGTVLREAVEPLLPLRSSKDVDAYSRAVDVAAWCAQGAPEAEDKVRPHRLWAARADQRVYTGSWTTRSMVAVLTLFVALPFYNRFRSRPVYQVLLDGPSFTNPLWPFVSNPDFVRAAHKAARGRLPWAYPNGEWPKGA